MCLRKLFSGKEQLHPDVWQPRSSYFKNEHTSPHGILPWPEALGSNNRHLSAACLGWVLTYLTHHSGGWRFKERSWHSVWQFPAILHGKAENYSGTNPWRVFVCEEERQGLLNKPKKTPTFLHTVLALCAEMPTLLTRKSELAEKRKK